MIQVTIPDNDITDYDREIRPPNGSKMLTDKQWYNMCNELGEINEVTNECWSISEVLDLVRQVSMCGTWGYATTHDFNKALTFLRNND